LTASWSPCTFTTLPEPEGATLTVTVPVTVLVSLWLRWNRRWKNPPFSSGWVVTVVSTANC
jgi:hypothetical protein